MQKKKRRKKHRRYHGLGRPSNPSIAHRRSPWSHSSTAMKLGSIPSQKTRSLPQKNGLSSTWNLKRPALDLRSQNLDGKAKPKHQSRGLFWGVGRGRSEIAGRMGRRANGFALWVLGRMSSTNQRRGNGVGPTKHVAALDPFVLHAISDGRAGGAELTELSQAHPL